MVLHQRTGVGRIAPGTELARLGYGPQHFMAWFVGVRKLTRNLHYQTCKLDGICARILKSIDYNYVLELVAVHTLRDYRVDP